jgi:hypothetical protein
LRKKEGGPMAEEAEDREQAAELVPAEGDGPKPITGAVARILTARELVINRGAEHGVKVGMVFQVLDPKAEDIEDPETGEVLGSLDRPKVAVRVSSVAERLAVARTFKGRTQNVGGYGIQTFGRLFDPPDYVKRFETLKTDEQTWEDLDESESFVKTGDPVRQVLRKSED